MTDAEPRESGTVRAFGPMWTTAVVQPRQESRPQPDLKRAALLRLRLLCVHG